MGGLEGKFFEQFQGKRSAGWAAKRREAYSAVYQLESREELLRSPSFEWVFTVALGGLRDDHYRSVQGIPRQVAGFQP